MTEAEWLACGSIWDARLSSLPGLSRRRFDNLLVSAVPILFGSEFCPPCREAIDTFAAGADLSPPQWRDLGVRRDWGQPTACPACDMVWVISILASGDITITECWNKFADLNANHRHRHLGYWAGDRILPEDVASLAILRDIFGNPFQLVPLPTAFRTPATLSLAQAAYDERLLPSGHIDNARLAVLSDALEEAGCVDADILAHLRSPGPHVRGCWALDLVLGRE